MRESPMNCYDARIFRNTVSGNLDLKKRTQTVLSVLPAADAGEIRAWCATALIYCLLFSRHTPARAN
jgi:hypothetical protein